MGIKVKAIERNVAFEKGKQKWAFVMQAELYSQLNATKVIEEAAVRSGLPKAVINAGWSAIGEVIAAWATEGHSVAVPGLGSLRFGLNSTAVEDVNKVSANLITRRYIIFVPNTDIKLKMYDWGRNPELTGRCTDEACTRCYDVCAAKLVPVSAMEKRFFGRSRIVILL